MYAIKSTGVKVRVYNCSRTEECKFEVKFVVEIPGQCDVYKKGNHSHVSVSHGIIPAIT
jgi:hypothetical protein